MTTTTTTTTTKTKTTRKVLAQWNEGENSLRGHIKSPTDLCADVVTAPRHLHGRTFMINNARCHGMKSEPRELSLSWLVLGQRKGRSSGGCFLEKQSQRVCGLRDVYAIRQTTRLIRIISWNDCRVTESRNARSVERRESEVARNRWAVDKLQRLFRMIERVERNARSFLIRPNAVGNSSRERSRAGEHLSNVETTLGIFMSRANSFILERKIHRVRMRGSYNFKVKLPLIPA